MQDLHNELGGALLLTQGGDRSDLKHVYGYNAKKYD